MLFNKFYKRNSWKIHTYPTHLYLTTKQNYNVVAAEKIEGCQIAEKKTYQKEVPKKNLPKVVRGNTRVKKTPYK